MATWLKLTSQTAIITGAASGIGRATAIAFAEQGCNLLLADSQKDRLDDVATACKKATTDNITVQTSRCDVTDKSQVQDAILCADEVASAAASSASSVSSILVNCAGITRDARVTNMSDADWDDVLNVNLKGTFLTCQAFCEPKRLASLLMGNNATCTSQSKIGIGGSIINIGSIVSNYGNMGQVNYAASKGGVVGLTRSLAKEMASFSYKAVNAVDCFGANGAARDEEEVVPPTVRVNCIQPGFIHTPMAHAVPDKILSEMTRRIALKRLGRAEDVANLALYLASSRSGYVTGEIIECSGMLRL
ncbi:hypothetical protein ACHAXR_012282 [Thalassiosira sp. AJA248-18]